MFNEHHITEGYNKIMLKVRSVFNHQCLCFYRLCHNSYNPFSNLIFQSYTYITHIVIAPENVLEGVNLHVYICNTELQTQLRRMPFLSDLPYIVIALG